MVNKPKHHHAVTDRLLKTGRGSQDNIKSSQKDDKERQELVTSISKRHTEKTLSCFGTPHKSHRGALVSQLKDSEAQPSKGLHTTVKIKDIVSKR